MNEPERRPCSKCGCPLVIVMGPNGKKIPLDARAPTYRVVPDLVGGMVAEKAVGAMVSHFASCPRANDFSASKRR